MTAFYHNIVCKIVSLFMFLSVLMGSTGDFIKSQTDEKQTDYPFVFVHGLSGWGSYAELYAYLPYWGMFGGDLMTQLNEQGFACYAASVSPNYSAWDRACELYAQLTGTVVDYGEAHSARCNHDRYGADYTGRALVPAFDAKNKINLICHSFGGTTARLFASILQAGSAEEQATTTDGTLSDFFKGNNGHRIYSIVTLASPHNGSSVLLAGDGENPLLTPEEIGALIGMGSTSEEETDTRIAEDYALYDIMIDNALALNEQIITLHDIYYFSVVCNVTTANEDGTCTPVTAKTEYLLRETATAMGQFTGTTEKGFVIDEEWLANDGLVNTVSAAAPFGDQKMSFNKNRIVPGVWLVFPTYEGDHMSLQGGFSVRNDVKQFYVDLLTMISQIG